MKEMLVADFSNARVGDKVTSLVFGHGIIKTIKKHLYCYMFIEWDCNISGYYNVQGVAANAASGLVNNTVFYYFNGQWPTIEACTRPMPKIEVLEKIIAWSGVGWCNRQ